MEKTDRTAITSRFATLIAARREEIALQWYLAISAKCSLVLSRQEALQAFSKLADRTIAFLTDPHQSKEEGRDIGKSLAKLHCIVPEVIDITGQLWADEISNLATQEESSILYPRLATLITVLAAGYFEISRQIILSEQEQIRQALVFNVEKASNNLKEYQIHLEEILSERTKELQLREKQYRLITDTSLLGIYQLDSNGKFIFANKAFLNMTGYSYSELIGNPFRNLIDPVELSRIEDLKNYFSSMGTINEEVRLKHKNGQRVDTRVRAISMQQDDHMIINGFVADITDQKRIEKELRASEERYRTLAATAQDLIMIIDRDGQITYINSFAADYVGLKPDQLIGQQYTKFFPKRTNRSLYSAIDSVFTTTKMLRLEEKLRISSKEFWMSFSVVPLKDSSGKIPSVFILAKDISDLKKNELALLKEKELLEKHVLQRTASLAASQERSRRLARQVVTAQEEERRRVSRELHDQAGQALISIKYELYSMYIGLNLNSNPVQQRFNKMISLIDQTTDQIRNISQNLHPPILDIAGLNLSIKEYCSETAQRSSLKINYHGCEITGLPDEIGISVFRILQELLTNILKHSQATAVNVRLNHTNEVIVFSVKDNGKGFNKKQSTKGLGLLGIQERVDMLGGVLKIQSGIGGGTVVTISIPWK